MSESLFFAAPLEDLAVLEIRGEEAAAFLHGQLTQDVTGLPDNTARLAGYCTPKGRLLATLVLWRELTEEGPVLRALIKADLAEALLRRLTMFVLRAKVKLSLPSVPVQGLWQASGNALDTSAPVTWSVSQDDAHTWIAAASVPGGASRWWRVPRLGTVPACTTALPSAPGAGPAEKWHEAEARAGLAWITQATQDLFLPQSLNLDLIGGLSFTKGCYPGQEVVARAHYRKAVKRRMALAIVRGAARVEPAMDVWRSVKPGLACGRIIAAAPASGEKKQTEATQYVLMELALSEWRADDLRAGDADGPALVLCPLPYPVLDEDR